MTVQAVKVALPGGASIALRAAGAGPAVLLLHGIGGRAQQWSPQMEALAGRYCVLAWDARGYGESDGPPVTRFSDFADDLFAVLDALGIARVLAAGHSMGGRILLEAAARTQDRFAALLLSGAQAAYLEHMTPAERMAYVDKRRALFDGGAMREEAAVKVARDVLGPLADAAAHGAMVDSFRALHAPAYLAALETSAGMDRRDVLAKLTVPTRVIGGALDTICPPEETRRIAEAIGQGPAILLDNVGHMAGLEVPETVTRPIDEAFAPHAAEASILDAGELVRRDAAA
ncbi:MAG: alpha/beta fold hydrolase [Pseudomonadota bacterium]